MSGLAHALSAPARLADHDQFSCFSFFFSDYVFKVFFLFGTSFGAELGLELHSQNSELVTVEERELHFLRKFTSSQSSTPSKFKVVV